MKLRSVLFSIAVAVVVAACAQKPVAFQQSSPPAPFSAAARNLAQSLVTQLNNSRTGGQIQMSLRQTPEPASLVIDPFIDADTGDVFQASQDVSRIITETFQAPPNPYSVAQLDSVTAGTANFIIVGIIKYEPFTGTNAKKYHLYASIINKSTGTVSANADSWISDQKIDINPLSFYKNSPMYIQDGPTRARIAVAQAPMHSTIGLDYINTLLSHAVSQEAQEAMARKDYSEAARLFQKATEQPNGINMQNYSGLYQSYFNMNKQTEASNAFYKMFSLAADARKITIKFLFSVDSVNFFNDPAMNTLPQYNLWIPQISRYMTEHPVCLSIIGHSSHSGEERYNVTLSRQRAQRVATLISTNPAVSRRIDTIGRGFAENIIGTGTDDDQDAYDRRVVFQIRSCG